MSKYKNSQYEQNSTYAHLFIFVREVQRFQEEYQVEKRILEGVAKAMMYLSSASLGCNGRQAWIEHAVDTALHPNIEGYRGEVAPPLGERRCYDWLANPWREVIVVGKDERITTKKIPRTFPIPRLGRTKPA